MQLVIRTLTPRVWARTECRMSGTCLLKLNNFDYICNKDQTHINKKLFWNTFNQIGLSCHAFLSKWGSISFHFDRENHIFPRKTYWNILKISFFISLHNFNNLIFVADHFRLRRSSFTPTFNQGSQGNLINLNIATKYCSFSLRSNFLIHYFSVFSSFNFFPSF